jgi:hypothetical protein
MKKIFAALLALISLVLVLTACTSNPETPSVPSSSVVSISQSVGRGPAEPESEQTAQATPTTVPQSTLPEYVPGSIKLYDPEGLQSSFEMPSVPEYRFVYYRIPNTVLFLVDDKVAKRAWLEENGSPVSPQTMLIAAFVKYFNIPKEDFVRVIEENRQASIDMGQDLNDEMNELPNPDIIYTFDNEIINYYYRRA